ncbi:MAG: sulfide/dihydroorotate dehydrogenase-like FAD/NAD-binding protein [Deltaproteobacteria bacterium]|nr:sulfide/dihydroorotate dehydrogenase-like FAD/NAD-binding protein [Deltaproteobacteria bacterium]MBW2333792.1 sulfide/dihydroorotate dehydrogenase-like FAD/NAD-binding protein [Deltaproteobacteria bacterium]
MYELIEKAEIFNVHKMVITAPEIAQSIQAGQFVIVMGNEYSERIPLTVSDWNTDTGTITLYILEVGISTLELARMKVGNSLYAVSGPLGVPSEIKNYGIVILGGGCYGIGGIYPIAKACKEAGNKVISIIEARYSSMFYHEKELHAVSDQVLYATSDGSKGIKGKVEDVIGEMLEKGIKIDHAFFMGCTQMLERCSEATRPYAIPTKVALNSIMLDGTGMCGACRVSVGGETKFACVDGPEFDGHKVDWKELYQRKSAYVELETVVYQSYSHECMAEKRLQQKI